MTVVYRGPERGYTLSPDDVMWLARAFVGEAGSPFTQAQDVSREEAAALFHCWMDRLMLVRARWSDEGWDFSQLLRAHSQPINPLWTDPDGSKCKAAPNRCTPDKIRRRKKTQALTEDVLRAKGVWQLAEEARDGTLERVIEPPTYDFAACSYVRGINIGNNCFQTYEYLSASDQSRVIPGEVRVDPSAETVAETGVSALLALPLGYVLFRVGEWVFENIVDNKKR